jgi:hypothetical protein
MNIISINRKCEIWPNGDITPVFGFTNYPFNLDDILNAASNASLASQKDIAF